MERSQILLVLLRIKLRRVFSLGMPFCFYFSQECQHVWKINIDLTSQYANDKTFNTIMFFCQNLSVLDWFEHEVVLWCNM